MLVNGKPYRTIWYDEANQTVRIIDQRHLPHHFVIEEISSVAQMAVAIKDMHVRGAGLIGAAAGFGMYLATMSCQEGDDFRGKLLNAKAILKKTRPTAVNLQWALERQLSALSQIGRLDALRSAALSVAQDIADEDAAACKQIGENGLEIIQSMFEEKEDRVNILTHCNAGWLAFVDFGSATAPIYAAHEMGIPVHVWVDETRPRNQGSRLTAWELGQHGIPHTIIADNTGGHLMRRGMVDLLLTGTDRTTRNGDVANKIGTYLKALAAADSQIPFYVALPSSSFDWDLTDGDKIPIEERTADEVKMISGLSDQEITTVQLAPALSPAANFAFDVTPARLVTGLITERGICQANESSILQMFPEANGYD